MFYWIWPNWKTKLNKNKQKIMIFLLKVVVVIVLLSWCQLFWKFHKKEWSDLTNGVNLYFLLTNSANILLFPDKSQVEQTKHIKQWTVVGQSLSYQDYSKACTLTALKLKPAVFPDHKTCRKQPSRHVTTLERSTHQSPSTWNSSWETLFAKNPNTQLFEYTACLT